MAPSKATSTPLARKRKRTLSSTPAATPAPSKRPKRAAAQTAEQKVKAVIDLEKQKEKKPAAEEAEDNKLYPVREILDESSTQYKIEWEGIDPKTGEPYPIRWYPKENANAQAVADWERTKALRAAETRKARARGDSTHLQSPPHATAPQRLRKPRQPPVVESSPISTAQSPFRRRANGTSRPPVDVYAVPSSPSPQRPRSSIAGTPTSRTPIRRQASPQVVPSQRANLDEFEPISAESSPYSALQATSTTQAQSPPPLSLPESSAPAAVAASFVSAGIIPDSQSQEASQGYLPSTEAATTSTQQQSLGTVTGTTDIDPPLESSGVGLVSTGPHTSPAESYGSSQQYPSPVSIPETQDPIESIDSSSEPDISVPETQVDARIGEPESAAPLTQEESSEQAETGPQQPQRCIPEGSVNAQITESQVEASAEDPEPLSTAPEQQETVDVEAVEDLSLQEEIAAPSDQGTDLLFVPERPSRTTNDARSASEQPLRPRCEGLLAKAEAVRFRHATAVPESSQQPSQGLIRFEIAEPSATTDGGHLAGSVHITSRSSIGENLSSSHPTEPATQSQAESSRSTPARDTISCRDFAESGPQEEDFAHHQDAQIVTTNTSYTNTPESSIGSVRPTTELEAAELIPQGQKGSEKVTEQDEDCSSESSASSYASSNDGSSPPPRVPSQSLQTFGSNAPPPLHTPTNSSQLPSKMSLNLDDQDWEEIANAVFAKGNAQSSLGPLSRRSNAPDASVTGTRSPSTIPDRSPQRTVPTSLREVAMSNSADADLVVSSAPVLRPIPQEALPAPLSPPALVSAPAPAPLEIPMLAPEPAASTSRSSVVSDASSDNGASLLNDDLDLLPEEYVVPLPMEGRQRHMYLEETRRKKDEWQKFVENPEDYSDIREIQALADTLRAVETHIDLLYSESDIQSDSIGLPTQMSWDTESSMKFRFLSSLFDSLRDSQLHLLVVIEKDNKRLFDIIQRFCQAKAVNYSCPAIGRKAKLSEVDGDLFVTILSSDSSPLVRPPSAIICVDGPMDTGRIRKNKWAINPDKPSVPVIDLIIPGTISHIQGYINPTLNQKRRLHTMFASLAHIESTIGKSMIETPSAVESGSMVAAWLQEKSEWELPSIGSIKDVIDFESQHSQELTNSPVHETANLKRPLEDDQLVSNKRARTAEHDDSVNAEITHVTDSMPGTAVGNAITSLQAKLEETSLALKASERSRRDFEAALDKRHNEFEDLRRLHLDLNRELKAAIEKAELANKQKQYHIDRFDKKAAELGELKAQFQQLQDINLASDDAKIAEITNLRKELAEAKANEERAVKREESTANTLEFVKESYQTGQTYASELRDTNTTLTAQVADYRKKAESKAAEVAKTFYNNQYKKVVQDRDKARNQVGLLQKQLHQVQDDMAKLKTGRGVGMGTRAQSVPRSPRVGGPASRGASPAPHRDRLTNLRTGQAG
ncbi:hypothetical protein BDV96DRAFT_647808 [Lophiotrema nucula]|uniref:Chromo domain-containing protein n=1 Tax=Lophiotrema nucula TaxID=690887 RepID=A0A6A5Z551_9PLEO|nr:hypothetical protein BDV96DRAFT_647808 [Lophiotrema nucula]